MKVNLDFTKVTDFSKPVPMGIYNVTLEPPREYKKDGAVFPWVIIEGKITSGEHAGRKIAKFFDTDPTEQISKAGNPYVPATGLFMFLKTLGYVNEPSEMGEFDLSVIANTQMVWTVEVNENDRNDVKKMEMP